MLVGFSGFGDCLEFPQLDAGGNSEERSILDLLDYLVAKMTDDQKEFTFQEVSQICYEEGLFEWMMEGKEYDGVFTVTPKCRSSMGRLLSRYAPSTDGNKLPRRYVRNGMVYHFGRRGKGRYRRYFVKNIKPSII